MSADGMRPVLAVTGRRQSSISAVMTSLGHALLNLASTLCITSLFAQAVDTLPGQSTSHVNRARSIYLLCPTPNRRGH